MAIKTSKVNLILVTLCFLMGHALSAAQVTPAITIKDGFLTNKDLPNRSGFKTKPIKMHAAFATEVQLDTNVFLQDKNEKFDIITILNPSVGLELPMGDNNFSVDYDFTANLFGVYTEHNYFDHRVRGLGEINFTNFKVTFSDVYKYFSDRAGSEDTNRVKRQNNFLDAVVSAEFDQLEFDAGYTFGIEDFISRDIIYTSSKGNLTYHDKDRFLNIFGLSASYRFLPKTKAVLESSFGILSYTSSKNSDSWYTETTLGFNGDLWSKFSANIRGGFRYQDYIDNDSALTDTDDFIGVVAGGGITYAPTKDDVFNLDIERSVYESTFQNINYYNTNYVGYKYTHFFGAKISTTLYGYYQLNLYPTEATVDSESKKRQDHFFGGGLSARYDIKKWGSLEAKYEFSNRNSNFDTYSYLDNLITFRVAVGF